MSLGASFSLVIWLITVVKIVTLITNLFFAILTYLQSSSLNQYSATHVTVTVLDATYLFILFVSVDMPAKEVRNAKFTKIPFLEEYGHIGNW